MRRAALLVVIFSALASFAQQPPPGSDDKKPAVQESPSAPVAEDQKLTASEPNTLMSKERIPYGARVYIAPMANGFDNYVVAGVQQKKVPIVVVADRTKAEFELTGIAETDKAGWAKMLLVNLRTGAIVFAYSVNKVNSVRGKQSAGEACAKHIKAKIVD